MITNATKQKTRLSGNLTDVIITLEFHKWSSWGVMSISVILTNFAAKHDSKHFRNIGEDNVSINKTTWPPNFVVISDLFKRCSPSPIELHVHNSYTEILIGERDDAKNRSQQHLMLAKEHLQWFLKEFGGKTLVFQTDCQEGPVIIPWWTAVRARDSLFHGERQSEAPWLYIYSCNWT